MWGVTQLGTRMPLLISVDIFSNEHSRANLQKWGVKFFFLYEICDEIYKESRENKNENQGKK